MTAGDGFHDLEDYGIVGNMETCAIISRHGSVDWLCVPFIESPSVFAALLDRDRGGMFKIVPCVKWHSVQKYSGDTNVLETNFSCSQGSIIITDFMPVKHVHPDHRMLVRKVVGGRGEVELEVAWRPMFDYGRKKPQFEKTGAGMIARSSAGDVLFLQSPVELHVSEGAAAAALTVRHGDILWFVLRWGSAQYEEEQRADELLSSVLDYWKNWSSRYFYRKAFGNELWDDIAIRSGLAIRLLSNPETGAVAAAATASLPESIGGIRNWDYRFAWIRDVTFVVQALHNLGLEDEAHAFRRWIKDIIGSIEDLSKLRVFYPLNIEREPHEKIIDSLGGYRDSGPVRVGNDAFRQTQLDLYGELVNGIFEMTRYGDTISTGIWDMVKRLVSFAGRAYRLPDHGIWEIRGEPRHFVYSKVMCWVALDRGIRIARKKGLDAPLARWESQRDEVRQTVLARGFNSARNSFRSDFDSEEVDASLLLIPMVGFLRPDDERIRGTLDAVIADLASPDGLVRRYKGEDGLPGKEGAFLLSSFWLVQALALAGRVAEAEVVFNKVLRFTSPLGLLSEEVDPRTGKLIGNFPQAYSHVGVINSALYLAHVKGTRQKQPAPMGNDDAGEGEAMRTEPGNGG